jgi:hypothetical protein
MTECEMIVQYNTFGNQLFAIERSANMLMRKYENTATDVWRLPLRACPITGVSWDKVSFNTELFCKLMLECIVLIKICSSTATPSWQPIYDVVNKVWSATAGGIRGSCHYGFEYTPRPDIDNYSLIGLTKDHVETIVHQCIALNLTAIEAEIEALSNSIDEMYSSASELAETIRTSNHKY